MKEELMNNKRSKKLPEFLRGCFWFTEFDKIDLIKNKKDIIHQILSVGDLEAIKWLFDIYGKEAICTSFLKKPIKTYRPQTFNWIITTLLDLRKYNINLNKYVINTPRYIGR